MSMSYVSRLICSSRSCYLPEESIAVLGLISTLSEESSLCPRFILYSRADFGRSVLDASSTWTVVMYGSPCMLCPSSIAKNSTSPIEDMRSSYCPPLEPPLLKRLVELTDSSCLSYLIESGAGQLLWAYSRCISATNARALRVLSFCSSISCFIVQKLCFDSSIFSC